MQIPGSATGQTLFTTRVRLSSPYTTFLYTHTHTQMGLILVNRCFSQFLLSCPDCSLKILLIQQCKIKRPPANTAKFRKILIHTYWLNHCFNHLFVIFNHPGCNLLWWCTASIQCIPSFQHLLICAQHCKNKLNWQVNNLWVVILDLATPVVTAVTARED